MKLIPIIDFSIVFDESTVIELVNHASTPKLTNYNDLFCRITFEKKDTFTDEDIIVRTAFNNSAMLLAGGGSPLGHLDTIELDNYEQIDKFMFISNEVGKEAVAWCQFFNKID